MRRYYRVITSNGVFQAFGTERELQEVITATGFTYEAADGCLDTHRCYNLPAERAALRGALLYLQNCETDPSTDYVRLRRTLLGIQAVLSGQEWSTETPVEIANLLRDAGYPVKDINEDSP